LNSNPDAHNGVNPERVVRRINFSSVLAWQRIGVKETDEGI